MRPIVAVSGGFDPIHSGHIALIKHAHAYGDVIVVVNSDAWLRRKKGYVFHAFEERAAILGAVRWVADVAAVDDSDDTVCEALERLRPSCFANGGDRFAMNTPEVVTCERLGIRLLFNIGGGKVGSSTQLVARAFARVLISGEDQRNVIASATC